MASADSREEARKRLIDDYRRVRDSLDVQPLIDGEPWTHPARADQRYRRVLEQMRAMLIEFDDHARVVDVSDTVEAITGYTRNEYMAQHSLSWIHDDDLDAVARLSEGLRPDAPPMRALFRYRHKNGHWVWLETGSVRPFLSATGEVHSIAYTQDVTERINAENALRESEERHRRVAEVSRDIISEVDEDGNLIYASPTAYDLIGFTTEEFKAMTTTFERVHPEDVDRVRENIAGQTQSEAKVTHIQPYRVRRSDGTWIWIETNGIVYERADGTRCFLAASRDVTEEIRGEQERLDLEAHVQQTQKLESLGIMAGGIAHDFNNLLTPILGAARLARMDLPEDSPELVRIDRIESAARRAAALTHQMLAYAGAESPDMAPVDVSQLIEELSNLLESGISRRSAVIYELRRSLPTVSADTSQLSQVAFNLVANATEAIEGSRGTVSIRTGVVDIEGEPLGVSRVGDLERGPHVFMEVEDTGIGMDAATRSRMFEPFFSTKFTGRGLGMAAALGIVRGHAGAVEIDSVPGRGTRIRVLLPVYCSSVAEHLAPVSPALSG